MDYWKENIAEAFEDAGLTATDEQIGTVAYWAESAHNNYRTAHGYDAIPSPVETAKDREIAHLKAEIQRLENDILIYRTSVARRRNVPVENVYLERYGEGKGDVIYDPS